MLLQNMDMALYNRAGYLACNNIYQASGRDLRVRTSLFLIKTGVLRSISEVKIQEGYMTSNFLAHASILYVYARSKPARYGEK